MFVESAVFPAQSIWQMGMYFLDWRLAMGTFIVVVWLVFLFLFIIIIFSIVFCYSYRCGVTGPLDCMGVQILSLFNHPVKNQKYHFPWTKNQGANS